MAEKKTYTFRVIVERDGERWHAHCLALEQYGVGTWGNTEEEAMRNIHEVVRMVVEELQEDAIPIPDAPRQEVEIFDDARVAQRHAVSLPVFDMGEPRVKIADRDQLWDLMER